MNVEIGEGLVIGPDDRLVVLFKDGLLWEEGALEQVSSELARLIGDRFLILCGDAELAKVERAVE
jgi:hypothetical protein